MQEVIRALFIYFFSRLNYWDLLITFKACVVRVIWPHTSWASLLKKKTVQMSSTCISNIPHIYLSSIFCVTANIHCASVPLQELKETEELDIQLKVFNENKEEDSIELSHRLDDIRAEMEYPFVLIYRWIDPETDRWVYLMGLGKHCTLKMSISPFIRKGFEGPPLNTHLHLQPGVLGK